MNFHSFYPQISERLPGRSGFCFGKDDRITQENLSGTKNLILSLLWSQHGSPSHCAFVFLPPHSLLSPFLSPHPPPSITPSPSRLSMNSLRAPLASSCPTIGPRSACGRFALSTTPSSGTTWITHLFCTVAWHGTTVRGIGLISR